MTEHRPSYPPPHICVVCGRTLDARLSADGELERWQHTPTDRFNEDHAPIAVALSEVPQQARPRCDFCGVDAVAYVVPATDFVAISRMEGGGDAPIQIDGPVDQRTSVGNWAACSKCGPIIDARDWRRLLRRLKRLQPEQFDHPGVEVAILAYWHRLAAAITGPLRRI